MLGGVLLIAVGALWTLQGLGVVGGSPMTGVTLWVVVGPLVVVAGIWLALGHIASAIAMAITIIGIPLAIANLKMVPISLMPLGKDIVSVDSRPGYV